ncbi:MAG: hypothetical protein KGH98_02265 [Candidatus Micrarchaeota archaeon]|nr:hypothetical protein [Candidatus Micrarchaeota archaeon]
MAALDPAVLEREIDEATASQAGYDSLVAIVGAIADSSTSIVNYGLKRALEDKGIKGRIRKGIMPYLYVAGFLSFAGREINTQNMSDVLRAMAVEPKVELIDAVLKAGIRSHLIYIYAHYLLVAMGKQPTDDAIAKIVRSIGIAPDRIAISEMHSLFQILVENEKAIGWEPEKR